MPDNGPIVYAGNFDTLEAIPVNTLPGLKTIFETLIPSIVIEGTNRADTLYGAVGVNETILGGMGNDKLIARGKAGEADKLYGGFGSDELHAGLGTVLVDGGDSSDLFSNVQHVDTAVLDFSAATKGVVYDAGKATSVVDGGTGLKMTITGIERIDFTGGAHGDTITGTARNDVIFGGGGSDTLKGGKGNDRLDGGAGADTLTGGEGADVFVFRKGEANGDRIVDFDASVDVIEFHGYADNAWFTQKLNASGAPVSGVWEVYEGNTLADTIYAAQAMITDSVYGFF
ncbi:calcium-binding protein [Ensifer soli]|uniref:calcium-binding protein n=1 Tax=Ciceribacter sp. sgz301302 TaxID=3342379 RepID=UPI0035B98D18